MHPDLEPIEGSVDRELEEPTRLKLPKGCAFLIDSNEAASNHLAYDLGPSAVVNLPVGDYSVMLTNGTRLTDDVVVERKSLPNLLGEIAHGRDRWERCLLDLEKVKRPHLVIEATWSRILSGDFDHTKVNPNAVLGSIVAWGHRHRIPVWLVGDRRYGQQVTGWILARAAHDALRALRQPGA